MASGVAFRRGPVGWVAVAGTKAQEKTEAEFLKSRSPLFKIDRIKNPLLIGQGANDPRVKKGAPSLVALSRAGRSDRRALGSATAGEDAGRYEQ